MKKISLIFYLILAIFFVAPSAFLKASSTLSEKLSGRIVLQVEENGEAWYVSPQNQKRYFLQKPETAFLIMKKLGTGIKNTELEKIPVGLATYEDADNDEDGLSNRFEVALMTNPDEKDSDFDGFNDRVEINNNYDPLSEKALEIDKVFVEANLGKIFLQVEHNGEAWYVSPEDKKRYYLGRPSDAFVVMKKLGLGISNTDLNKIMADTIDLKPNPIETTKENSGQSETEVSSTKNHSQVLKLMAEAIRKKDVDTALNFVVPEMKKRVRYTLDFFDDEGKLTFANILSGANLVSAEENEAVYKSEVYYSLLGYEVPLLFYIQKNDSGDWLLLNL